MTDTWQRRHREHLFFTWSTQRDTVGIEIDRAEGARFHVPGKGWVWDLESQVFNVNVGHANAHIKQRMMAQIESLPAAAPHVVLPIRAELASLLNRHSGFHKAFLATGGSEAVENAIKIARLVTGRTKIVTRRHSYHGATSGALAVSGDPRRAPFESVLPEPTYIEDPYPPRAPSARRVSDWVESLEAVLTREGPENVAAVMLEGLTGTNGVQIPPSDFWPRARALCDQHRILLIDDEIFSGFGRTGRWFAFEHWGVRPDMVVIGKGLASGYAPLAGVLVSEPVARHFDDTTLWCGLTSYAHPVSCAAAVGSIEVLERERLPENAAVVGGLLQQRLRELIALDAMRGALVDVRGLGLMLLVEFDRETAPLTELLWDEGLYAPVRGRTLMLAPPLCLAADQVELIAAALERAFTAFVSL